MKLRTHTITDRTQGVTRKKAAELPEPSLQDVTILSVDPGTTTSGWVFTKEFEVLEAGSGTANDTVCHLIRSLPWDYLLIEEILMVYSGRTVGQSTFRTQLWAGVYFTHGHQLAPRHAAVRLIPRVDAVDWFRPQGKRTANDATIRKEVLKRYPATGAGKTPEVGTQALPGPLFGVTDHAWQALGNAVFFLEHYHKRIPPTGYNPRD